MLLINPGLRDFGAEIIRYSCGLLLGLYFNEASVWPLGDDHNFYISVCLVVKFIGRYTLKLFDFSFLALA